MANDFSELCHGCGGFLARGQDFQNHRAICVEKPFPEQGDHIRREDAAAYNPAALMPEGHRSSSSRTLKQLIAATLRSGNPHPEYENKTLSHHQNTATAGQCISNMDLGPPEDNQDVQVISDESNYRQK